MKGIIRTGAGLALLFALTACQGDIEKVVQKNMDGFQEQNVDMVMETIDTQSPNYDNTKAQVTKLIKNYNLDFHIDSISVISKPEDEAKAMEKAKQDSQDSTGLDSALDTYINEDEKASAEAKKQQTQMEKSKMPLTAEVKVIQTTRKRDQASNFISNRVIVLHTLHKYPMDENPQWKIYKSDIVAVNELPEES